jgi:hypothetical protein
MRSIIPREAGFLSKGQMENIGPLTLGWRRLEGDVAKPVLVGDA